MNQKELIKRIDQNPGVLAGKPVIRGTSITVQFILNLLARGATEDEIIQDYKDITKEDIHACLMFASVTLDNILYMPVEEAI